MNPDIVYAFFKKLENDTSGFIYQGEFNSSITEIILRLSDNSINHEQPKLKNRVSFLIAECFQNIVHHSDKPNIIHRTNNLPEMFLARNIGNTFYIASTNLIDNKKIESIKSKLESLNNLSKEDLKLLYLEVLSNNEYSEKGGAGLGMIEIARKTGQKIEFEFEYVNYFLSLFHLQLKLKDTSLAPSDEPGTELSLGAAKELHDIMFSDNILLVYKGDFSQESILPILAMIENNLKNSSDASVHGKKTYYLLVELLQNISKHGKTINKIKEGVFMIGIKGNGYFISTGNFIENKKVEKLRKNLLQLNNLDKEELAEQYKKRLIEGKPRYKGGAGLGLIDIARFSGEKLIFDFKEIDQNLSFFSMNITT